MAGAQKLFMESVEEGKAAALAPASFPAWPQSVTLISPKGSQGPGRREAVRPAPSSPRCALSVPTLRVVCRLRFTLLCVSAGAFLP